MEDNLKNNKKMEDDLKKNENGRQPQLFFEKLEWRAQKKMEDDLKRMEDNLKKNKKWKTTSKIK